MKLGIIGKPQCGKTTIFNAAAGRQESVGDFSQAIHRAIIKVPDERVNILAVQAKPRKITFAEIEFLDAPGLTGKGKASDATEINPEVRLMDALMLVIDAFSPDATPEADVRGLIDELFLADQILAEQVIEKKDRRAKLVGNKEDLQNIELLRRCLTALENGSALNEESFTEEEAKRLTGFQFLTLKPFFIVLNIDENSIEKVNRIASDYAAYVKPGVSDVAVVCGKIEAELVALDEAERTEFMTEIGITAPAVTQVIQKAYSLLGLISFLTTGEPEVRAWTIKKGTKAVKAAGVIHSDIERGFIRAEVVKFVDYAELKTLPAIKAAGKSRLEGKEYVVEDGDVILFRFAV